jgi:hypothetical protein
MSWDEATVLMKEITDFGKSLTEQKISIKSPGISALGIPSGEFDLQRFIYNSFFKCFWNSNISEQENVAINGDWYHPQIASKHTLDEVMSWFEDCNLKVIHALEDEYGITIRGAIS